MGSGGAQQSPRCLGGHGALPNEQNTQQSPGRGRSIARQCGHSKKNTHASVGMRSSVAPPHDGQRMVA